MIRNIVFTLALLAAAASAQVPVDVPAAAQSDYSAAQALEHGKEFAPAADGYRLALKHAPDCLPCLEGLVRTSMALSDYKSAATYARKLSAAAQEPAAKAHGLSLEAQADYRAYFAATEGEGAIEKNPKHAAELLRAAESASAEGLSADPSDEPLRMLHGHILAAQKRDADAAREFAACAASSTAGPAECARALRLSHDLDSARGRPAPAFSLKTLDGNGVSLDKLSGRIAVIDFWGTWCVYCRSDADYIQSMLDTFPKDKFTLVEIDEKDSRATWKDYLRDNSMEGVQAHDGNGSVADLFHVSGYPTYIVLDGNGVIRNRYTGAKGDIKGDVKTLLAAQPTVN